MLRHGKNGEGCMEEKEEGTRGINLKVGGGKWWEESMGYSVLVYSIISVHFAHQLKSYSGIP